MFLRNISKLLNESIVSFFSLFVFVFFCSMCWCNNANLEHTDAKRRIFILCAFMSFSVSSCFVKFDCFRNVAVCFWWKQQYSNCFILLKIKMTVLKCFFDMSLSIFFCWLWCFRFFWSCSFKVEWELQSLLYLHSYDYWWLIIWC